MVNREQDVIDRVQSGQVSTVVSVEKVFSIENFDESMLNDADAVFDIDTIGHRAHSPSTGSPVTPVEVVESFDLFKLQDEESMEALDPTKEPPPDWEPAPDEAEVVASKWEDLQDGFGIV